ncbi:MAG: hypothetical protein MZU84_00700 [Sphingobacterium sp.]|nr:hypothetical protein [Sphingobacterium sp.]
MIFILPRRKRAYRKERRLIIPTCSPETAMMCMAPDLEKDVSCSLSRSSLSPIVRAVTSPSSSPLSPALLNAPIIACAAVSELSLTVRRPSVR